MTRTPGHAAADDAAAAAKRVSQSPWIDRLARVGLAARGLVYILIGVLAAQIAVGQHGKRADQSGALQSIAGKPFGTALLWLIVVGFLGYAAWLATEALWGHRDEDTDAKRTAQRVVSAAKTVVYLVLAALAGRIAAGGGGGSGGQGPTAKLLKASGGRWLVALAGIVVIAVAAYLAVEGIKAKFERHLATGRLDPAVRRTVVTLGRVGYVARAVVTAVLGGLIIAAAWTFDPKKARGLDTALRELASQPYGRWLLLATAAGLICFGAYSFVESRYRRL